MKPVDCFERIGPGMPDSDVETGEPCGDTPLDVHPRVAMQILRHSRISVTMEIYTDATRVSGRSYCRTLLLYEPRLFEFCF